MNRREHLFAMLCLGAAFFLHCGDPVQTTGGSSGGEAFAGVTGTVQDTSGIAVEHALVEMRSADQSFEVNDAAPHFEDTTDANGIYAFQDVPPGDFLIQATRLDKRISRVLAINVAMQGETVQAKPIVPAPLGGLVCVVDTNGLATPKSLVLAIFGTDKRPTSTDGRFDIEIAPGEYTIAVALENDVNRHTVIEDVEIHPATTTTTTTTTTITITGIGLPSQRVTDSLAVLSFLGIQGISANNWDKVVRIRMNRIRELNLSNRSIQNLHDQIGSLTFLNGLYLDQNPGITLPGTLADIPGFTAFTCNYSDLDSLPSVIGRCTEPKRIEIEGNRLKSFPHTFGNLDALNDFNAAANHFTSIPSVVLECRSLKQLDFGGNRIDSIPSSIGQLTSLTVLSLPDNALQALPWELSHCSRLQFLHLWSNQLTVFPPAILSLTDLEELQLQDNSIQSLPAGIADLTRKHRLFLSGNEIVSLPESVTNLPRLSEISMGGNRLCSPSGIVEQWLDTIAEASWRTTQRGCE